MLNLHHFDITLGKTGNDSNIKMDGQELHMVQTINIEATVCGLTTVRLVLHATA